MLLLISFGILLITTSWTLPVVFYYFLFRGSESLEPIGHPCFLRTFDSFRVSGIPIREGSESGIPKDPYAYVEAAMQEPPSPDFVTEPVYPEFMPPEDDVLPAEEQPLPAAVSPTTDSPGYITKSDPKEDSEEEDEDEDEEEEEEHLALADSVPPPAYLTTARMYIQD
ncbi:hypothetical protein Tco_0143446 [Tanacetum coccineum]